MTPPLLSVRGLGVQFTGERTAQALSDLSFDVGHGEVLALLGESGCGKSVTLRTLLRLHAPQRTRVTGQILVEGRDVLALRGRELQHYRGGTVSMVFQEPGLAFDPVYTIETRSRRPCARTRAWTARPRASARCRCSSACKSRRRAGGSMPMPTNSPAACASAP